MLKKKVLFVLIMIIIVGFHIETLAFDLQPNIDQQELEENRIKINLQLSDLQDYEDGINVVSGKFVYDSEIFESVSFTGTNSWSCVYNNEEKNENQGKFILITTAGNVTQEKEIAEIELKLKKNIKQQKTEIKIEQIETSYHAETIATEDKVIDLEIKESGIEIVQNDNLNIEESKEQIQDKEVAQSQENKVIYLIIIILSIFIIFILIILVKMKGVEKK